MSRSTIHFTQIHECYFALIQKSLLNMGRDIENCVCVRTRMCVYVFERESKNES
jgi:hypothetical protein